MKCVSGAAYRVRKLRSEIVAGEGAGTVLEVLEVWSVRPIHVCNCHTPVGETICLPRSCAHTPEVSFGNEVGSGPSAATRHPRGRKKAVVDAPKAKVSPVGLALADGRQEEAIAAPNWGSSPPQRSNTHEIDSDEDTKVQTPRSTSKAARILTAFAQGASLPLTGR
jgi:hypothetical protein